MPLKVFSCPIQRSTAENPSSHFLRKQKIMRLLNEVEKMNGIEENSKERKAKKKNG